MPLGFVEMVFSIKSLDIIIGSYNDTEGRGSPFFIILRKSPLTFLCVCLLGLGIFATYSEVVISLFRVKLYK